MKKGKTSLRHVVIGGKNIGRRCVMYCQKTGEYVDMSCSGTTKSRFWAWSGTVAQAQRAAREFNIDSRFAVYHDGEEKSSV